MVAGHEKPSPIQVRGQPDGFFDRSEREITEMEDGVVRSHHLGVHLFHSRKRSLGEFADACVTEMLVRGDEVDLVEIEPRILVHCGPPSVSAALAKSRYIYRFARQV